MHIAKTQQSLLGVLSWLYDFQPNIYIFVYIPSAIFLQSVHWRTKNHHIRCNTATTCTAIRSRRTLVCRMSALSRDRGRGRIGDAIIRTDPLAQRLLHPSSCPSPRVSLPSAAQAGGGSACARTGCVSAPSSLLRSSQQITGAQFVLLCVLQQHPLLFGRSAAAVAADARQDAPAGAAAAAGTSQYAHNTGHYAAAALVRVHRLVHRIGKVAFVIAAADIAAAGATAQSDARHADAAHVAANAVAVVVIVVRKRSGRIVRIAQIHWVRDLHVVGETSMRERLRDATATARDRYGECRSMTFLNSVE